MAERSHRLQETSLRYFLEVVRCGSVTEASTRLHVTASAVSRQIAVLEDVLKVSLFDRQPRGMVPSAAGELLAVHAQRGALEADRVVSDIDGLQGLRSGRIRIAACPGFAVEFLPRTIAAFRAEYPGIIFHLRVLSPADVTAAVLRGDVDIGLNYSRAAERNIRVEHRQAASVLAIMRPDHALAHFHSVTLAQMQPFPIALPEVDNTVRQLFDIGCSEQQIAFDPVFVCNQFETLTNFVMNGGGLSISGLITIGDRVERGELHAVEIRERGMSQRSIEFQTLNGRTLPEVVRVFLEFLRSHMRV